MKAVTIVMLAMFPVAASITWYKFLDKTDESLFPEVKFLESHKAGDLVKHNAQIEIGTKTGE